jgi:MHS family proline/betaine transporter-like MFS transporter
MSDAHTQKNLGKKVMLPAILGNLLEWYDFAVYGFLAAIIGKNFFPNADEIVQLLSAFAAFGVGFLVRPLGAVIIGRIGDVKGRKTSLTLTMFLMAAGTVAIGCLPTFQSIGLFAPILLVLARLVQGFSAGGEWAGATAFIVEWAPENRRGFFGSLQQSTVAAGLLMGSLVAAFLNSVLTTEQMLDWGWRLPFLLGAILGPVGLYMRRNLEETPAYRKAKEIEHTTVKPSTGAAITMASKVFGFTVLWSIAFYILLAYMPTFTQKYAGLTAANSLWSNSLGLIVLILVIPLCGHLSDKWGRKPLLIAGCISFIVLPYLLFSVMVASPGFATVICVQIVFALMISLLSGPGPAAVAEIFPTSIRSTWMSTGYALGNAVFGGFAPFIATWLIAKTGSPISPTYYVSASAVAAVFVVLTFKETAKEKLA